MAQDYQRLQAAKQQVQSAYQTHLGRDADDTELLSHLGGGRNYDAANVSWAVNNIANSEEARKRREAATNPAQATPVNSPALQPAVVPPNLQTAATQAAPRLASAAAAPLLPPPSAARPVLPAPTGQGKVAVEPSSVYQGGQLDPLRARTEFSQYAAPAPNQVGQLSEGILTEILRNPDTMSEDVVNQFKARGRDTALSVANQLRGQVSDGLLNNGFSSQGGVNRSLNREIDSQLIADILDSNREIDITAASTNRQDRLNALGAGSDWESALADRAQSNYRTQLAGQQAASDDTYRYNTLDLERFKTAEDVKRAEDASRFRNDEFRYTQQRDDRAMTLQEFLGQEGVNLDWARLDAENGQFNQTFGENRRQFNNSLGFDYAKLTADQQNRLADAVARIIGG